MASYSFVEFKVHNYLLYSRFYVECNTCHALATKDALNIPPDVRRYIGDFLRPSILKQDAGQGEKSRNHEFEYIYNALVRAGGTLTKEEVFRVKVSFCVDSNLSFDPRIDFFNEKHMDSLYRSILLIVKELCKLLEREDILDAGIVVKKVDGSYTFHDDILSLICHLL